MPVAAGIGEAARTHPDDLLFDLMNNGHLSSAVCHDGQNFFDTDHPVSLEDSSLGTQSNYRTSMTLDATNFFTMRAAMAGFKGDSGRNLRVVGTTLVVPPALEKVARETVAAATVSTGGANVAYQLADVVVANELGGDATKDKTWYLLDTRKVIKPFVYQVRRPTTFVQKFSETDDNVLMRDEYLWAATGRYNLGYGPWFLAMKCVGSSIHARRHRSIDGPSGPLARRTQVRPRCRRLRPRQRRAGDGEGRSSARHRREPGAVAGHSGGLVRRNRSDAHRQEVEGMI